MLLCSKSFLESLVTFKMLKVQSFYLNSMNIYVDRHWQLFSFCSQLFSPRRWARLTRNLEEDVGAKGCPPCSPSTTTLSALSLKQTRKNAEMPRIQAFGRKKLSEKRMRSPWKLGMYGWQVSAYRMRQNRRIDEAVNTCFICNMF